MVRERYIVAGLAALAIPFGVTFAPPASADCTNAGYATICADGQVRDVNAFFTSLKGMSRDQMRDAVVAYGQSNPQVQNEIQAIRQPAADFRVRCQAPVPEDMPGS